MINNKIYIGVHKTKNLNDNYMGSGKSLRLAIEKYGLDNFKKEILETFDCFDSALQREKEIVNQQFLERNDVYNMKEGGSGGWNYINTNRLSKTENALKKMRNSLVEWHAKNDTSDEKNGFFGKKHSEETKKIISEKRKGFFDNGGEHPKGMLGKKHSEQTKKHVSEVLKEKSSLIGKKGLNHPAGGTKWYNNGIKHLRTNQHPGDGWFEGRIFKERKRN